MVLPWYGMVQWYGMVHSTVGMLRETEAEVGLKANVKWSISDILE